MTSLAMAVSDSLTITRRNLIKVRRVPDLIVFATLSLTVSARVVIGRLLR